MLIFPPSIKEYDSERPVIIFKNISNIAAPDEHIVFPIPQSIQFSDSAAYNGTDLGFSGSMLLSGLKADDSISSAHAMGTKLAASVPKDLNVLGGLVGALGLSGGLRSAVGIATGTTLNKNVVTEFSGVATRQFSFQFKLISSSRQEALLIKQITDKFRLGLYPEGDSLQLRYPPSWYINFMQGEEDIKYIPKIFETYLTTMSTSYNSSMNLFHPDGAPVETDIQLTFMESRALTLDDIKSLVERPFEQGDFVGKPAPGSFESFNGSFDFNNADIA